METRHRGILAAVAIIVAALALGKTGPQKPAPKPAATGRTERTPSTTSRPDHAHLPCSDATSVVDEIRDLTAARRFTVDSAIVTVPDPLDSQVGWFFDSHVEAIERAVEYEGFLLHRYFLPWECSLELAKKQTDRAPEHRAIHRDLPGIVVFRSPDGEKLRLLFLVGELPTGGIHRAAFKRALCLASADPSSLGSCLTGDPHEYGSAEEGIVRIVGPTFSGSAVTLRWLLEEALRKMPARSFTIISGSASADSVLATLTEGTDGRVRYAATTAPTSELCAAAFDYLHESKIGDDHVAVLSEGGTLYGAQLHAPSRSVPAAIDDVVEFKFPLHVSSTRSAFERDGGSADTADVHLTEPRSLKLEVADELNPRDVLPPLSPDVTAVNVDADLKTIFSAIRRNPIRYVIIVATDPRDSLFLAERLHEYAPSVRVVMLTEAFLLYAHPEARDAMDGALVVSTYPLSLDPQIGRASGVIRAFPSNLSEGAYNATLASFGRTDALLEYGWPGSPPRDAAADLPSVWVSAVGHDGLLPLAVYPLPAKDEYVLRARSNATGAPKPRLIPLGVWAFLVIALGFIVDQLLVWGRTFAARGQDRSAQRAIRAEAFLGLAAGKGSRDRYVWAAFCMLPLLVIPAFLASAAVVLWRPDRFSPRTLFLVQRALDLANGRSLVPLLVILVALFYVIGFAHLRRIALLTTFNVVNPLATSPQAGHLKNLNDAIENVLRWRSWGDARRVAGPAMIALLPVLAIWQLSFDIPTVDFGLRLELVVAYLLIVVTTFQALSVWRSLRPLLVKLAHHPIARACERLASAGITTGLRRDLYSQCPALGTLEPSMERWRKMAAWNSVQSEGGVDAEKVLATFPDVAATFRRERTEPTRGLGIRAWQSLTKSKCEELARLLVPPLEAYWDTPTEGQRWFEEAEEFVALEVASAIGYVRVHVWNLLTWATVAAVLFAFTLSAYPMYPRQSLSLLGGGVLVAVVGTTLSILVQMERDVLLSRLTGTREHEVETDWTFARQVLTHAVLPVVSLLAAQIPQLGRLVEFATRLA